MSLPEDGLSRYTNNFSEPTPRPSPAGVFSFSARTAKTNRMKRSSQYTKRMYGLVLKLAMPNSHVIVRAVYIGGSIAGLGGGGLYRLFHMRSLLTLLFTIGNTTTCGAWSSHPHGSAPGSMKSIYEVWAKELRNLYFLEKTQK